MLIKIEPIFRRQYWGGEHFREYFGLGEVEDDGAVFGFGTAFAFACQKNAVSNFVKNPPPKPNGNLISLSLNFHKDKLFGKLYKNVANFPFTVEFVSTSKRQPLQVNYVSEGDENTSEFWYILEVEGNSEIFYGFDKKIDREEFKISVADNTVIDNLRKIKVKKGDYFQILPKTVYAVGENILLVKIYSPSTARYNVFDWERYNEVGVLRENDFDNSLEVLDFCVISDIFEQKNTENVSELWEIDNFNVQIITVTDFYSLEMNGKSFHNVVILQGIGYISDLDEMQPVKPGDSFFVPACDISYTLYGELKFLLTYMT